MEIQPNIEKSAQFGNLKFPTRKDYANYFIETGAVKTESEIWNNKSYVSIIHRHWHGEGRNGCIFALLAARKAEELGWYDFAIIGSITEIESGKTVKQIDAKIQEAIDDPTCEVLSLLFSKITTDEEIARLIVWLLKSKSIVLEDEQTKGDWITLALRTPLVHGTILSWLMAFGPYSYFPQTRQSPITEIAIRVKPKPEEQFHRLTKDKEVAHLADLPLDYKDEVMEKTWTNTLRRTRLILGEEPNQFSAAKTTFTLPKNVWLAFK